MYNLYMLARIAVSITLDLLKGRAHRTWYLMGFAKTHPHTNGYDEAIGGTWYND